METPAADRLSSATGFLLLRVGDAARERIERELAHWGLVGRDLRVLGFACDEAASQRDLCRLADMDRTTMVAVLDKLERLGYAQRERSATDRRKHLVSPTEEGRRVFRAAADHLEQAQADFLASLAPEERRQLNVLLGRLFAAHDPTCAR